MQVWTAEVYHALRHVATLTQRTSLYGSLIHVLQAVERSNLQLPRDSSVAVPQGQRPIPKGGSPRKDNNDGLPELNSSFHKCCMVMVVSNGLTSTLIWSKFPGGACSQTPLQMLYAICAQVDACYTHHTNPHSLCMGSKFTWMTAHPEASFTWTLRSTASSAMHIWGKKICAILHLSICA